MRECRNINNDSQLENHCPLPLPNAGPLLLRHAAGIDGDVPTRNAGKVPDYNLAGRPRGLGADGFIPIRSR